MLHFLFPAHPLEPGSPDDLFVAQREALSARGFTSSLLTDAVLREGRRLRGIPPAARVVYRGWMLNPADYSRLVDAIAEAGASPFTTTTQYLAGHYLPNWQPLIAEHTPETRVFPAHAELASELRRLGWGAYFLKDYVKSLKTASGSIVRDPSEVARVLDDMRRFRGEIEGGVCVRRVEDFLPETERRYFVLDGLPSAPDPHRRIPEIVSACASALPSPFFSIDVIERGDGVFRVVEVGDGQVSDLVGWTAERFADLWPGAS